MRHMTLFLILGIVLAGCADTTSSDPADVVVKYMQAKVDGDRDMLASLLCAELESTLSREAQSFSTVEASLEDVACQRDGDIVTCSGAIVADYGGENTEFPLSSYRVLQEDGVWKWCGEAG